MILDHAVQNAAIFAEQEITGVVITVPPYFNQAQRKALLLVGKIAKIRILQLINTNTAVACVRVCACVCVCVCVCVWIEHGRRLVFSITPLAHARTQHTIVTTPPPPPD
jgi:hypothetical protein